MSEATHTQHPTITFPLEFERTDECLVEIRDSAGNMFFEIDVRHWNNRYEVTVDDAVLIEWMVDVLNQAATPEGKD